MTVYLSIPNLAIDELVGWGVRADPDRDRYRLAFADVGQVTVYRTSVWGEREVLSMSIEDVTLTTSVRQVIDRSRLAVGGTGVFALAMIAWHATHKPGRGNKVIDEYAVLIADVITANGARRHAVFAVDKLDEDHLRARLAQPLHDWAAGYVQATVEQLDADPLLKWDRLNELYTKIDRMKERDVLSRDQALAVCSHASHPYVGEFAGRLRHLTIDPAEATRIQGLFSDMHDRGHLSDDQLRRLRDLVATRRASTAPRPPSAEQCQLIKTLADLRQTGVLTEAEYQAEKARLLRPNG